MRIGVNTTIVFFAVLISTLGGGCADSSEDRADAELQRPLRDASQLQNDAGAAPPSYVCGGFDGGPGRQCSACTYFALSLSRVLDDVGKKYDSPCIFDEDCIYVPFPDISCGNFSVINTGRMVLTADTSNVTAEFEVLHDTFCNDVDPVESVCAYNLEEGWGTPDCVDGTCVFEWDWSERE